MSAVQTPAPHTAHQPNALTIFRIVQAYQQSYLLKAAVELDLFTAIAQGKQTAAEIAQQTNAAERGVRVLCDALAVLGLLNKTAGRYTLTPDTAFFLDSRSPGYMGRALNFLLHPMQVEGFRNFAEAVRLGGSPEHQSMLSNDDPIWIDFARGMAPLMMPAAQAIAQHLASALGRQPSAKVLDVAAGHGLFGIVVAQQLKNAQIYAVDWENVLEVAHQNADQQGVGERHHLLPGSAFEVEFGSGYDAALLTNFMHHFDPQTNEQLLRRVHAALRPGGEVIILEFVPNEDRISPPVAALFSTIMLASTPKGDAFTFNELAQMCRAAGFSGERLVPLDPMPEALVIARKQG